MTTRLSKYAQLFFKRESSFYQLGAKAYLAICPLLKSLKVPSKFLHCDLALLHKIVNQSIEFKPKPGGKHIVFLSIRGWPVHLVFETLLAARLRMEGHRVTFLSCFDSLPLCMYGSINNPPEMQRNCKTCMSVKNALWQDSFEVEYLPRISTHNDPIEQRVDQLDLNDCRSFVYDGAPYGDLVHRGIVWFLRRSMLSDRDLATYRKTLLGAHAVRCGLENFLNRNVVDTVLMLNGDFSWEKVASWVLLQKKIRFITHDYTFHERLIVAVNRSVWDDLSFDKDKKPSQYRITDSEKRKAEKILHQWRKNGGYQGHLFWSRTDLAATGTLRKQLNLDDRPLAIAYTNMTFESSVIFKNRVFQNQFEWIKKSIEFFKVYQEFQLIIRIHPAEVRKSHWRPNESLYHFIKHDIRNIPKNVILIAPDDKLSSYKLGVAADVVLVYTSTLGMEMADRNKCVITAAHVHYSMRGFTVDPDSENEYFESIYTALTNKTSFPKYYRKHLIDYVAWLFFHRLTSFEAFGVVGDGWPQVKVSDINDLLSTRYFGINRLNNLVSFGKRWW